MSKPRACRTCGTVPTVTRLRSSSWLSVWRSRRRWETYCPDCTDDALESIDPGADVAYLILTGPIRLVELERGEDAAGAPNLRRVTL